MSKPVYIAHWAYMCLLPGPHMGPLWACPYGLVHMRPIWVHYGLVHYGPSVRCIRTYPYGLGIWATHGPFTGLPYEVGILAPHGSIMSLSIWTSRIHSSLGHMVLSVWDPYGSLMGLPIWETRKHPSLGPYGNAIWATYGSISGVSLCACPHWTHIGTIWACPYGLDCM